MRRSQSIGNWARTVNPSGRQRPCILAPRVIRRSAAGDGALWALAVSGALGFWLGAAVFAQWQVAVETAQVIAGLIKYPPDNPFFIYHVRLWTVLHEALALLLRLGVWEVTASRLTSGLLGMFSLQALSMVIYAFSRNAMLATGGALVASFSAAPLKSAGGIRSA